MWTAPHTGQASGPSQPAPQLTVRAGAAFPALPADAGEGVPAAHAGAPVQARVGQTAAILSCGREARSAQTPAQVGQQGLGGCVQRVGAPYQWCRCCPSSPGDRRSGRCLRCRSRCRRCCRCRRHTGTRLRAHGGSAGRPGQGRVPAGSCSRALTRVAGLALPAAIAGAVEVVDKVVAAAAAVAGVGEAVVGIWGRGRRVSGSTGGVEGPRTPAHLPGGAQACGGRSQALEGRDRTHWCRTARPPSRWGRSSGRRPPRRCRCPHCGRADPGSRQCLWERARESQRPAFPPPAPAGTHSHGSRCR